MFSFRSAAAVNAEMISKRKELLEVRCCIVSLKIVSKTNGYDDSNINQVADYPTC